jgi:lipoprotein-anchoring transpeptidase ErfK/SrfK
MKKIYLSAILVSSFLSAKNIEINLEEQMIYAYDDGDLIYSSDISSGTEDHKTPEGNFKILEKKKMHKSNIYPKPNGGGEMNYMLRLTNTGIAIHLGYLPGFPDSHGCIRLPDGDAQKIWKWATVGTDVKIINQPDYDSFKEIREQVIKYGSNAPFSDPRY